jgi:hypothetical protein
MIRKIPVGKIIGKTIKFAFFVLIFLINAVLIFRMCSSGEPSSMKVLMVNEKTAQAYVKSGDDLEVFYQRQDTITRGEHNSGYFSVEQVVFIPEAEQVQVLVRYNNSTIKALANDFNLPSVPDRNEDLFDVTLVKTTDLTPDDKEDNTDTDTLLKERFHPSSMIKDRKGLYNYRKFIFDGVKAEDAVGIFVDIYYNQQINYEDKSYGTLCIYDDQSLNTTYKLTSADKKALKNAKGD